CRSCIVRHLETSKFCPICDVQVHKAKPLHSIRLDRTLQTLAYKLVPGLYYKEIQRRRSFNASSGSNTSPLQEDPSIFTGEDSISLSLEYYDSDKDYEEGGENGTENEIEKNKQMPHRRYLQCPAAVSMKHLKKFIRMKYGLGSEHRVDIIYAGECLRDDFCLMDVAYTFSWKREESRSMSSACPHAYVSSVSENSDALVNNAVEAGSVVDVKEASSEGSATSPERTTSGEGSLPRDDAMEPETKKMKMDEDCRESTNVSDTKSEEEEKVIQEAEVEEKRQRRGRKRASNSDGQEHHDAQASGSTDGVAVPTTAAPNVTSDALPSSEETNTNEELPLQTVDVHDDAPCDEPVMKETCTSSEETGEAHSLHDEEAVIQDSVCVEESNATDSVVDSIVIGVGAVDEGNVMSVARDGEDDDKEEEDFTQRLSASDEEGGDENMILDTNDAAKHEDMEDKQQIEVEERKKLKGKKDGRKKSKHKSKHHHPESYTRKRKAHRSESTPTILQYQEDVMKLKVKLGPIKPVMSHRHHHHHHHSKHNRKNQLEEDTSSTSVGLHSNGETSSSVSAATSAKERLLQMRAVRHKNINTSKSTTMPASSTPVKDDTNNRTKRTEILMPPSSITVSKVNIADKRKSEAQKSSNSSSAGGEESKRPSLEIMLVNAPTTTTVSTTTISTATTTISASNTVTEACATVRQSGNDTAARTSDPGNYKPSRPPPPTIPLVRIRKNTVSSIRPPSGLTITPKLPTSATTLATKTSTAISKTTNCNKVVAVSEIGDQSKEETSQEQCNVLEDEQAMRHDDIGALDLSGKSSRYKTALSPVTSPTVGSSFPSPPSPAMKTSGGMTSSTHQSILSITQSLVHRQLQQQQQQQQQHGLVNISSSSPGKVSKSPSNDSLGSSVHPAVVTAPVYAMSNLKTLSDTAVRIRNEMAAQSDKSIRSGGTVKPQLQQKSAVLSVQMTSASEAGSSASTTGRTSGAVTYTSSNSPRSGLSQPPTRSPTSHQQYQALPNNSIPPLRIPIPPTALSKVNSPMGASSRTNNVPRLHDLYPSAQSAIGRGRSFISGLQNRSGVNNHTKPGPNQAVRHIPNPSALLFRQQQAQNRLQQQNSSAVQNRHAAVSKALFNNQNNFNNTTIKPSASTSVVQTAAPPVSSIRKMENMTRNIEKVAAGLTVRAVEAHTK
ncbi:hypothetical protein Cfor_11406, partial [Coptotermes formosanus]